MDPAALHQIWPGGGVDRSAVGEVDMVKSATGEEDRVEFATEKEEGTRSRRTSLDLAACSLRHRDPVPHATVPPWPRTTTTKPPQPYAAEHRPPPWRERDTVEREEEHRRR
jgi:hypothetical protein